jgi:5-methylcytosine-specific restriction endonuclease McrA
MRDGYECAYCGETADTVDHVISRHHGGDMWSPDNLVAACKRCNSAKGDRPAKKAVFSGSSSTPPVFIDNISPTRSIPADNNPFTARPIGN